MVIGTAGHVDHGKTALVQALTGVNTDRLPEEQAREISIELGFAPLTLPDGTVCSVVDVPGHERFIKNMLAGATGVDVILLVVDAREGIMPQTREHLDILTLLGVGTGVVALTKTDTVPPGAVPEALSDVRHYLDGTSLAGSPVVPVSARTGEGLAELLAALTAAVAQAQARHLDAGGPVRLAVDRAFQVPGFGQVVTGTVATGRVAVGDRLQVYPQGPVARVRRIEVHGSPAELVRGGERAALNLAGDLRETDLRGAILATPGSLRSSRLVGLGLRLLPGPHRLPDLTRLRLHTGTAETLGRLIRLPDPAGAPSGAGEGVAFEAESPLALAPGQAFVIRSYSPSRTIGGGKVLSVDLSPVAGPRPRTKKARQAMASYMRSATNESSSQTGAVDAGLTDARSPDAGPAVARFQVPGGLAPLESYQTLTGSGAAAGSSEPAPALPPGVRLLPGGRYVAEESYWNEIGAGALKRLAAQHGATPHLNWVPRNALWSWLASLGLPPAVCLETLAADGAIELKRGRIRLAGRRAERSESLSRAISTLTDAFRAGGFSPPSFPEVAGRAELDPELAAAALEVLVEEGELISPAGLAGASSGAPVFHAEIVGEARRQLERLLARDSGVTVAAFRDTVGSTRKYVLPLLEYFDRAKVTQRRGDIRVKHPLAGHGGGQDQRRSEPREGTGS